MRVEAVRRQSRTAPTRGAARPSAPCPSASMEPEAGFRWQPVNGLVGVVGTSFFVEVAAQPPGSDWLCRQPLGSPGWTGGRHGVEHPATSWCCSAGTCAQGARSVDRRRGWARRHRSGTHRVTLRRDDARTQLDRPINLKIGLPDRSRLFASWRWRLGPRWFSVPSL